MTRHSDRSDAGFAHREAQVRKTHISQSLAIAYTFFALSMFLRSLRLGSGQRVVDDGGLTYSSRDFAFIAS